MSCIFGLLETQDRPSGIIPGCVFSTLPASRASSPVDPTSSVSPRCCFSRFPAASALDHSLLTPSRAAATFSEWPLCPPVCASPACLPGHCQGTLSRKACPITEFPCLNRSVCLPPTEKWSSLAHAHSLSPVSISPPPQDALHSALSSPVPCLLLCLLRGSFCFCLLPSFWSAPADLSELSLNGTYFKRHLCTFAVCQALV